MRTLLFTFELTSRSLVGLLLTGVNVPKCYKNPCNVCTGQSLNQHRNDSLCCFCCWQMNCRPMAPSYTSDVSEVDLIPYWNRQDQLIAPVFNFLKYCGDFCLNSASMQFASAPTGNGNIFQIIMIQYVIL